jgi:hypothetical protein
VCTGYFWLQIGFVDGLLIFNFKHRCGDFSNPVISLEDYPLEQGSSHFVRVEIDNRV